MTYFTSLPESLIDNLGFLSASCLRPVGPPGLAAHTRAEETDRTVDSWRCLQFCNDLVEGSAMHALGVCSEGKVLQLLDDASGKTCSAVKPESYASDCSRVPGQRRVATSTQASLSRWKIPAPLGRFVTSSPARSEGAIRLFWWP